MSLLNAHLFKPETVAKIEAMGMYASRIADRWVGGWPKETKALEAAGQLLPALKEQASREAEIYSEARMGGENSHLADHELAEMYGLSPEPPSVV